MGLLDCAKPHFFSLPQSTPPTLTLSWFHTCTFHAAVNKPIHLLPLLCLPLAEEVKGGGGIIATWKYFLVSNWFSSHSVDPPQPQALSDVRAQSKDADSTLQMDWACSCWGGRRETSVYWQGSAINIHLRDQCKCSQRFPAVLTELMHWYTQMLHSSCFESVVFSASRFLPAPRPSS